MYPRLSKRKHLNFSRQDPPSVQGQEGVNWTSLSWISC